MKFLLGTATALAAVSLILGVTVAAKNREEARLRHTLAGWDACALEVKIGQRKGAASACPAPIAAADLAARRAASCDAALAKPDLFGVEASCSAPVKRAVAERDAGAREIANLTDVLAQVRRDQAAAIARAEARGQSQTQRTDRAQTRLDAAPRTDTGLGRCDADCLQRLGRD